MPRLFALVALFATLCVLTRYAVAAEPCSYRFPIGPAGSGTPSLLNASANRTPALSWDPPADKSYLVPALEIPALILALNGFSRLALPHRRTPDGKKMFDADASTIWDHLVKGPWHVDNDNFKTNQLLHPYQGSLYHAIARSSGLNYWESQGYTFLGSFLWEIAGETSDPSINDQVASGIAGSFLGEPLFRMASLLLEGREAPGFWRELAAAAISPPVGFNRLVFGERFDTVFPSRNPALFWQAQAGAIIDTNVSRTNSSDFKHSEVSAAFSLIYGLPGKPGYHYDRPFDYFEFHAAGVSDASNALAHLITRGLLAGGEYEAGGAYRGAWGLYGCYDYISPHTFRVSNTALAVGTTGQWWLSRLVSLQGTALAGVGYGAGGDISGAGDRNYHYGISGQGSLSLRLILGTIAMLDMTGSQYHISDFAATAPRGNETVRNLTLGLTLRLSGRHAVGLQYLAAYRYARYPRVEHRNERINAFTLVYTFLSEDGFGAVDWRSP